MAGFRMHLGVATACGVGYGAAAVNPLGFGPEAAVLAAGLTAVGGMLPDLDSDSGRPIKELFALAGTVVPLLLVPRLQQTDMSYEGMLAFLVGCYVFGTLGMNIGYHRLLTHRGFSAPRWLERSLAILGICCLQESPTVWAALHRRHHHVDGAAAHQRKPFRLAPVEQRAPVLGHEHLSHRLEGIARIGTLRDGELFYQGLR